MRWPGCGSMRLARPVAQAEGRSGRRPPGALLDSLNDIFPSKPFAMLLKNRITGERKWLRLMTPSERSLWLMQKSIRDLDAIVAMRALSLSFFTQTQSDATIGDGTHTISRLMGAMRQDVMRAGEEFWYVSALEIQPKRYLKYGVMAAHWHAAIACSMRDALPHAQRAASGRIERVRDGRIITFDWLHKNSFQKLGMYFICDAWSSQVYGYLSKYLPKPELFDEFKARIGKRAHIFSSSHFPIEYKMTFDQYREFLALVEDRPDAEDLYWRREGSRIVGRAKRIAEREWGSGWVQRRAFYDRVISIPGIWLPVGGADEPGAVLGRSPGGQSSEALGNANRLSE